ncbi:hypothetical protein M3J09_009745 [Ascochyta lentis]
MDWLHIVSGSEWSWVCHHPYEFNMTESGPRKRWSCCKGCGT